MSSAATVKGVDQAKANCAGIIFRPTPLRGGTGGGREAGRKKLGDGQNAIITTPNAAMKSDMDTNAARSRAKAVKAMSVMAGSRYSFYVFFMFYFCSLVNAVFRTTRR